MKFKHKQLLDKAAVFILVVTLIVGMGACKFKNTSERFEDYLDESFISMMEYSDTLSLNFYIKDPGAYGINVGEVSYGEVLYDDSAQEEEVTEETIQSFKQYFNYNRLTDEQKVTFDIMCHNLELSLKAKGFEYYESYCKGNSMISSYLPMLLAEFKFYTKNEVETYLKLLETTDEYFSNIAEYERRRADKGIFMSDYSTDIFVESCEEFINSAEDNILLLSFEQRIGEFSDADIEPSKKEEYINRNKELVKDVIIPAYEQLKTDIAALKGRGKSDVGLAGLDKGKEYYEYLVGAKVGTGRSMEEIKTLITDTYNQMQERWQEMSEKDETLYDQVINAKFGYEKPEEILEYLKSEIKKDYPEIPDVEYTVKYVEEYLEKNVSPAFFIIPPIDMPESNTIYINNSANTDLFVILAHEGYPGHLYQSVYTSSLDLHPLRNVMRFLGYAEGWATYVQFNSYEYGDFSDTLKEALQLNYFMGMLEMAYLDININYNNEGITWLEKYLADFGLEDDEYTESLFYSIADDPAAYLPYVVGALEIMDMRQYAEESLKDKFDLKEFHKAILDVGEVPLSVLYDYVDEYVEKTLPSAQTAETDSDLEAA